MTCKSLGAEQLARWRHRKKLPNGKAALILQIDQSLLSKYECGHRLPTRRIAIRIRQVAGVSVEAWDMPSKQSRRRGK